MKKTIIFLTLLIFVGACTTQSDDTSCFIDSDCRFFCPEGCMNTQYEPKEKIPIFCEMLPGECKCIDSTCQFVEEEPILEKTYFLSIANFGEESLNLKINYEGETIFENTIQAAEMELAGHPRLSSGEVTVPEKEITLEIETPNEKYSFDTNPEFGDYMIITYLGDALSFRQDKELPLYD